MRKWILFLIAVLLISSGGIFAQDADPEPSLEQLFPVMSAKNPFPKSGAFSYYRFPKDTQFFEYIDLSFFPHETWDKKDWALLGRRGDSKTYSQIIYTDEPYTKKMIHGTDISNYGYLKDFYLYADLFVLDNYPEDTGSCYVYYSNSVMTGYKESKGILIDPENAIYTVTNSYGGSRHRSYTPRTIKHTMEPILELDPSEYTSDTNTAEIPSFAASSFTRENIDGNFNAVREQITSSFRMKANPSVRIYRIEVIRRNGNADIFINGKQVFSMDDGITTTILSENDEVRTVPDRVSWTAGPILEPGGLTVTCSIGNFYIFGTGQKED